MVVLIIAELYTIHSFLTVDALPSRRISSKKSGNFLSRVHFSPPRREVHSIFFLHLSTHLRRFLWISLNSQKFIEVFSLITRLSLSLFSVWNKIRKLTKESQMLMTFCNYLKIVIINVGYPICLDFSCCLIGIFFTTKITNLIPINPIKYL